MDTVHRWLGQLKEEADMSMVLRLVGSKGCFPSSSVLVGWS